MCVKCEKGTTGLIPRISEIFKKSKWIWKIFVVFSLLSILYVYHSSIVAIFFQARTISKQQQTFNRRTCLDFGFRMRSLLPTVGAPSGTPSLPLDLSSPGVSTPKRRCFAHSWARSHINDAVDEVPVSRQGGNFVPAAPSVSSPSPLCDEFNEYFDEPGPCDFAPRFKRKVSYMEFLRNCIRFKIFREQPSLEPEHDSANVNKVHSAPNVSATDSSSVAIPSTNANLDGGCSAAATAASDDYARHWSLRSK